MIKSIPIIAFGYTHYLKILAQSLIIRFLKPLKAKCPNECKISFLWEVRITMNLLWLFNTSKFGTNLRIQLYIVLRSMSWKSHWVIKCISSSIAFCQQYLHILLLAGIGGLECRPVSMASLWELTLNCDSPSIFMIFFRCQIGFYAEMFF